ncbi:hypothetical protein G6F65_022677 [Rhizopus arrhizus]|nr:hypothetical protein G6F68_016099 [Rhizopus microsporus]KAG1243028.1 hypothetical protein G6F65_022677 [Rhizopus arrhizus]
MRPGGGAQPGAGPGAGGPRIRADEAPGQSGVLCRRHPRWPVLAGAGGRCRPGPQPGGTDAGRGPARVRAAGHVRLPDRCHPGAADLGGDLAGADRQR